MGSCFRWKRKNSYTVTQVDEYSPQGGKYQASQDQLAARGKAKTTPANIAASQWAAESREDTSERSEVTLNTHDVMIVKNDDVRLDSKPNDIKENGFHVDELNIPTPEPSPPFTFKEKKAPLDQMEANAHVSERSSIEHQPKVDDCASLEIVNVPETENVYVNHQSTLPDVTDDIRDDVIAHSPNNIAEVAEQSINRDSDDYDDSDDEREDPIQAREMYLARKASQETGDEVNNQTDDYMHTSTVITETQTQDTITNIQTNPDVEIEDNQNVLNSHEDIHMTDSPAGTWDARLNKDVRAELDEVQRSLDGSKTDSTASLEALDLHEDDDIPSREPVIIQRVQFNVPDTDEEDETVEDSGLSYSNEAHLNDLSDNPLHITSYQTYQSDHVLPDPEEIDNDTNDRLASITENEYDFPGEPAENVRGVVSPQGYSITYEERSSTQRYSDGFDSNDPN